MSGDDMVKVWEEAVSIPTYGIGQPEKNPMFLEKRVYQGSSGVVYPHPIIESVRDQKEDKAYHAIFLENEYLKIMLLPQLGGRVQMALDKTNGYHFIYYNQVIKPALVGLTGPWISGGIEFNWPQHHRPSTFEPVDYRIDENNDGSKTVWFSEIERMFRTKGMAGFTLYPRRAYLEINVQLYNRTSEPQTFLWWANPAVHVNDDYQSVFPPDVYAVMDHGKRDVSSFPIATGTYYKYDYSPGTDISRYKNIPVPTSYMAYHSDFDFVGCYDHGKAAGMMHVANHHVVPGKKQWTWGNGNFGQAWDRQLTDEDGPYIELMCGAYTDNQPDFSWLQPGEEKRFTQIFMPYKQIGAAKNVSRDVAINLELEAGKATLGVYVSQPRRVTVRLTCPGTTLYEKFADLSPEQVLIETVDTGPEVEPQTLTLSVWDGTRELIRYTPIVEQQHEIPNPAVAAKLPQEIESNEALFLNGLHLEQYRHATFMPEPYYEEALRRDPGDSRCNNALGLLLLRRGKFKAAEPFFRKAIETLTQRNPNPYDGEPFYNLGLCLRLQGRYQEAVAPFYKAVWNAAWQHSAYFELARLAARRGQFEEALELAARSLITNWHHHKARHLKIAILRHLGCADTAAAETALSLSLDRMDFGALHEQSLLNSDSDYQRYMGANVHNYIEVALDYAQAGLFSEGLALLEAAPQTDPMVKYYAGWIQAQAGDEANASRAFLEASQMSPDYCFPHRIECVNALETALVFNPDDARAAYYLGNFWYAHRRYDEAIACWEQSTRAAADFPTAWRNLGLAYMNQRNDATSARAAYERAFELDPSDTRVLFELDQLYKKLGVSPESRLELLESHSALVDKRDDLIVEYVTLLNLRGQHTLALDILQKRTFHPWEGGEGKVAGQYVLSLVELAKQQLDAGDYQQALDRLEMARQYPPNLAEGKLAGAQENHINYFAGIAYETLGQSDQARQCFRLASVGLDEPTSALYYNDQPPDMIFYQGLARQKLGEQDTAVAIFRRLISYGEAHLDDEVTMDYFAVSLPDFLVFGDDLNQRNRIHCHYMMALGHAGLGETDEAMRYLDIILSQEPYHLGAAVHKHLLQGTQYHG